MKLSALIKSGRTTDADREKHAGPYEDTPVPALTWRSLLMGAFVSIGGIVFGYDTGQISGFLEMKNFKERYGQLQSDGTYHFSNVRSGLIVALVCIICSLHPAPARWLTHGGSSCPLER